MKSVFKAPLFLIDNKYIHKVGVDGGRCVTTQSFTRWQKTAGTNIQSFFYLERMFIFNSWIIMSLFGDVNEVFWKKDNATLMPLTLNMNLFHQF